VTSIWHRIRGRREAPLTCIELVELVTAYLEDGLDDAERRRFDDHIGDCPACTNYLDQFRQTIAIAGRLEAEDLSEDARSELLAAFRGWARGPATGQ